VVETPQARNASANFLNVLNPARILSVFNLLPSNPMSILFNILQGICKLILVEFSISAFFTILIIVFPDVSAMSILAAIIATVLIIIFIING